MCINCFSTDFSCLYKLETKINENKKISGTPQYLDRSRRLEKKDPIILIKNGLDTTIGKSSAICPIGKSSAICPGAQAMNVEQPLHIQLLFRPLGRSLRRSLGRPFDRPLGRPLFGVRVEQRRKNQPFKARVRIQAFLPDTTTTFLCSTPKNFFSLNLRRV